MRDVICSHPSCREAFLEPLAHPPAIEFPQPFYGFNSLLFVIDHKTGDAFVDYLGDRARAKSDNGRAACHRFDHDQAERFGPIDGKEQRSGSRQKRLLRLVIHFAGEPNLRAVDLRFEPLLEIAPFAARQLGRDAKLHPGSVRDANCAFRSFLGRQPPQKGELGPLFVRRAEYVDGKTVMDRTAPIRPGQGQTLIVGYRDERGVGKSTDHIPEPRQIEPPVHRREEGHAVAAQQRQMQPIDVRVHDVEIFDPLRDRLEQSGAWRPRDRRQAG